MTRPRVFLGMPTYDGMVNVGAARSFYWAANKRVPVCRVPAETSALGHNFNILWCGALEMRDAGEITHFAMLHADVVVQTLSWVDVLMEELLRLDADLIAAVVRIKNTTGLTSTAIDNPETEWEPLRRLTIREVHQLPETFDAEQAGYPGHKLLTNTGCFLCDLRKPWVDRLKPGTNELQHCFTLRDRIVVEDGKRRAQIIPEDWALARHVQREGGTVYATRKLDVQHVGHAAYSNQLATGDWDYDRAFVESPEICIASSSFGIGDGETKTLEESTG